MDTMNMLQMAPAMAVLAEGDIEQGRRFWRDTLGFQEIAYDEGQRQATFRAGQSTWFSIYEHQGGSKCDHTQLSFAVQDLGQTVAGLRQAGIRFEEYDLPYLKTVNGIADMADGSRASWFTDPGGNIVGVFQLSQQRWQQMQAELGMAAASR